ncbi:hypothetical protein BY996DRAFT_6433346 [Phakopsora pachyrhizi]|nr:hypothetical protein BY996DRAFT_6433346 [Phakopsora pachyrhizi]
MVSTAIVGTGCASCCTVLSIMGVAHVLMGSRESPENGKKVSRVCFASAIVYLIFTVICCCQIGANRRVIRGGGGVHL